LRTIVYGSTASGLALEGSDIDIAIQNLKVFSKEQCLDLLHKLKNNLSSLPYVKDCKEINAVKVPVIKLLLNINKMGINNENTEMKVDITIDDSTESMHSYVLYGIFFTNWVIQKLKEFTHLKALVLLLKKLLSMHGLNIPYHGGISSYVLTLMLTAFLYTCPQLHTPAQYFLEILRYYGQEFKSSQMAIIQGQYILIPREMISNCGLMVVDLYMPENNAAASVTKFEEVRELLSNTYEKINKLAETYDPKQTSFSILDKILA